MSCSRRRGRVDHSARSVDCAIVGWIGSAANGDVSEQDRHRRCGVGLLRGGVPFVVAAPWQPPVDLATASEDIEIEERSCGGHLSMPECGGACWKRRLQPSIRRDPARMVSAIALSAGRRAGHRPE